METLGVQSDLIKKLSNIYWILPYYGYAYESVKVLRWLCQKSRSFWIEQQNVIIRMLKKQTIDIRWQVIDEMTIKALKRCDRYKLFKFRFLQVDTNQHHFIILLKMLTKMPDLEISKISIMNGYQNLYSILAKKPMFKNMQDLFKVLEFEDYRISDCSEPYEYISRISYPRKFELSWFIKQAG